ncbi:MAG: transposase [Magnetococcales bacterium]|nr:transposase [Magnetococcales bacterium]
MSNVTAAVPHLTKDEILGRIKETTGFRKVQKWLIILNATVDPRPAEEIAIHTGMAKQTVLRQPSHSPELNPTEHIWEELREKHFHNKAFNSLDGVAGQKKSAQ